NFIGETTNLIAILRERAQLEWFKDQSGSWNEIYEAPFSLRLTPFGFCFTFNIMNASDVMNLKEVSPDFHYDRDIMMHSREINTNSDMPQERMNSTYDFPWISTHSAPDSGLTLTLNSAITSVDWWCSRFEGFNFYVHSPNELQSSTNNFQLQFGELTEVLIKPKLITTEEDLGSYNLE
ncbi:CLUMA_CG015148, isoform A, partial [Clunio marinus]